MEKKIGVGIVGASPLNPGWGIAAHIPAIQALPTYYELKAVSTSRIESAKAAEKEFGVPAYDNHIDLINNQDVDLVVVAIKLPNHYEVVSAAINAGKMVYCEWPLGKGLEQSLELARQAKLANVRTVIGVQARFNPVIKYVRDLIRDGYIGKLLGTSLVGSGMAWGDVTNLSNAYTLDNSNGVNMLSIPVMHTLDALTYMLGDFKDVSAESAVRQSKALVKETGETITKTAPDQVAILGTLESGTIMTAHYQGGVARGENLRWTFRGSEGELVLNAGSGQVQLADNLKVYGATGEETELQELSIPEKYYASSSQLPEGVANNVGQMYLQFAKDLQDDTHLTPDFEHAIQNHELLDVIEKATIAGEKQTVK
ncbi:Gfo/Idh/MocA family protein [Virgibacillus sp. CBA3643]|uniref:Gfo/Idh/MocA family protein n=1 Tax=Virgibacillus sp. CBA3643 TaxID=2942278 RepID=UPI0035A2DBB7